MSGSDSPRFHAVRKSPATQEVVKQVGDLLMEGRFHPGERLPAERELAQVLQVGRTTVREAIRTLEALGMVTVRPGEGTFLATVSPLQLTGHGLAGLFKSIEHQAKLFEVRLVIEPGMACLAAQRATAEHLERLRVTLEKHARLVKRGERPIDADTDFHYILAEATGNGVLVNVVESLLPLMRETRELVWSKDRGVRSLRQHRGIFRALEARNARLAETRMRRHIGDVFHRVSSVADHLAGEAWRG